MSRLLHASRFTWAWPPQIASSSEIFRDVLAGVLAAVVLIGNIVSFGGLMFPGDLSAGIPTAIWAMLIGSGIGGVWIALGHPCRRSRQASIRRRAPYSCC